MWRIPIKHIKSERRAVGSTFSGRFLNVLLEVLNFLDLPSPLTTKLLTEPDKLFTTPTLGRDSQALTVLGVLFKLLEM